MRVELGEILSWAEIRARGFLRCTYPLPLSHLRLFLKSLSKNGFNSKLAYKMRKDRNRSMIQYADKLNVRDYVKSKVGEKYLPELFWSGTNTTELLSLELPNEFVVKPNHACGALLIVENSSRNLLPGKDKFRGWQSFSTNIDLLSRSNLKYLCDHWLSKNFYYLPNKYPEWVYKHIKPQILIEELLVGWNSRIPTDYKFFVFDGKCKMIFSVSSRFENPKADLYDRDWNRIKGEYVFPPSVDMLNKPPHFEEMLLVAEALGNGMDFIRVDLYSTDDGVKFSELTNYPAASMSKISPKSLDIWLGADWFQPY